MSQQSDPTELINRFLASRDPALREELVVRFVPLVHYVLGRLGAGQEMGDDYQDLVSQGLLGLIEAVDRYNPGFGTQFSTYASVRVRGKILDYLRSMDWLSRTARNRSRTVQKAVYELWGTLGQAPTEEQIAQHVGMEVLKVQEAMVDSTRVLVSLDSLMDETVDGETSLYELLPDENQENPSEIIDHEDLKQNLIKVLKDMPEREQQVLSFYYYEDLTFKEIGEILGITESRVCQLHARAIMNLKGNLALVYRDMPHPDKKEAAPVDRPTRRKDRRSAYADPPADIDSTRKKKVTYV